MANGDKLEVGGSILRVLLLDKQSASASGPWIHVSNYPNKALESTSLEEGATDAQIEIMISNQADQPETATDGPIAVTLTTTSLFGEITHPCRWIKAKKTAGTTPIATTVNLVATRG